MDTDTDMHKRKTVWTWPRVDGGRDCTDAAANQGMSRIAGHHRKLGRGKEGFYPESQRDTALPTP